MNDKLGFISQAVSWPTVPLLSAGSAARRWSAMMSAILIVLSCGAIAKDCDGVTPEAWLVGTWEAARDVQTLVVRRDGATLVWTYDRKAGVKSERWGDKVAAGGSGTVDALDGCRAILKGRYTRFDGPGQRGRPPVGSPMEWKFLQTGPGVVSAEGLGYGQEKFQLRWRKLP